MLNIKACSSQPWLQQHTASTAGVAYSDPPVNLNRVQEKRIASEVESLERDTGFKLRVLAQNYPETPGQHWTASTAPIPARVDPWRLHLLAAAASCCGTTSI